MHRSKVKPTVKDPHLKILNRIDIFLKRLNISRPTWTELLIWFLGLSILIGLASKEFIPLYKDYANNNEGTQTKIINHNDTIKPPLLTLCIPRIVYNGNHNGKMPGVKSNLTVNCENCDTSADDSSSDSDETEEETRPKDGTSVPKLLLLNLFGKNDSHALKPNITDWDSALVDKVWEFFHCLKKLDSDLNTVKKHKRSQSWCSQNADIDRLLSDKRKVDALFRFMVEALCDIVELRGGYDRRAYRRHTCVDALTSAPAMFFGDQFCFSLPTMNQSTRETFVISNTNSKYRPKESTRGSSGGWALYSDIDYLHLETGANFFSYPIYISEQNSDLLYVGYSISSVAIDKVHRDCYPEQSQAMCRSDCMIMSIRRTCGCDPFMFRNNIPLPSEMTLPYCNSSSYNICKFNRNLEARLCGHRCVYQCRTIFYQFSVTRQGKSRGHLINRKKREYYELEKEKGGEFNVVIYPVSTVYFEFSITIRTTWEQFVSQVSAVANLYLGIGGISMLATIIFFGKTLLRYLRSAGDMSTTQTRSSGSTENIGHRGADPEIFVMNHRRYRFMSPVMGNMYTQPVDWGHKEQWQAIMEAKYAVMEKKLERLQKQMGLSTKVHWQQQRRV